jgi:hypothetical protein
MPRFVTLAVVALALICVLSYAAPAVGGPHAFSSANPVALAKKALSKAKKADRKAGQARKKADQALAKLARKQGFLAANVQTVTSSVPIAAGAVNIALVGCPPGTVVVTGGYSLIGPEANVFFDHKSGNGWSVGGDNTAAVAGDASLTVEAQCAPTGNAVVSSRSARVDRSRDGQLAEQRRAATIAR